MNKYKLLCVLAIVAMVLPTLAGCATPTPQVVEKVVKETVVVEKEKVVEKVVQQTVVVNQTSVVVVTPTAVPPTPQPASNIPFKNPDTLIVTSIGEPQSLDPSWTYETAGSEVEQNIYEGVVAFNREKADDFVPALAEKWSTSADGLTWTFNIRKGVKFHDGGTLEPHDVAYSWQRFLLQDRTDGPAWLLAGPILDIGSIAELTAGGDVTKATAAEVAAIGKTVQDAIKADDTAGTVTLKLKVLAPYLLQILAGSFGAVYDQEWMAKSGEWDGKADSWLKWHDPAEEKSFLYNKANGTGPYKLEGWKPGEEYSVVAFDGYWRKDPIWKDGPSGVAKVKRIVWKVVPEWGTRLSMLKAGDTDFVAVPRAYISQVDPMVKESYAGGDTSAAKTTVNPNGGLRLFRGYTVTSAEGAMFNYNINVEGGNPFLGSGKLDGAGIPPDFFSDPDVRKGFNYAFDSKTYIKDALQGEAVQPKGPIIVGMLGYDEKQAVYPFDMKLAEESLKKAWKGELWAKGMYIQLLYNQGNESRRIACEILKKSLEALNPKFTVSVVNLPWPAFLGARTAKKLPFVVSGWAEDYHDPSNWVNPYMNCAVGAYARAQSLPKEFCTKEAELEKKGISSVDPKVREPIYKELQNLAYTEAMGIWLSQPTGRSYQQIWIQGWFNNPLVNGIWGYPLSKVKP